ncbi:3-oxoacyl-[acyl-carrier-protein] synthase III C-terminal domain-containing protein [Chloroflexota bacterium]
MAGITSYGAYIPYYRLPRDIIGKAWGRAGGRGEKAVANYDEDPISMSVAAGMDCLKENNPKAVGALFMSTTTALYKERQNASIIATALDMCREVRSADFGNSLKAGTTAMLSAFDAVNAGSLNMVLVTAADMRLGGATSENEQSFGDGAAALLFGNERVVAEIEGSHSISDELVDNWRAHDDTLVRSWEERFGLDEGYRKIPAETAAGVMKKLNLTPEDFAKACFYGPNTRRHQELGKAMGFQPAQIQEPLLDTVGNTGTALPLMILVAALEEAKAGDRILLVSWGNGSDAIVLRVTNEIEKVRDRRGIKRHLEIKRTLNNYATYLRWRGLVALDPSPRRRRPRIGLAAQWRESRSALPLYGVKCKKCGTSQMFLNFSSTRAHVCVECQTIDEFEPYRFADKTGSVFSFSHDYLAVSQDPPNTLTVVDFEGGGRGAFEMADRDPEECQVGMKVEMTFRKMFFDLGIHNYFWKCKPARD